MNKVISDKQLLFLSSSPSDYIEILDLAVVLAANGYSSVFVYLCESGPHMVDVNVIKSLKQIEIKSKSAKVRFIDLQKTTPELMNIEELMIQISVINKRRKRADKVAQIARSIEQFGVNIWARYTDIFGKGLVNRVMKIFLLRSVYQVVVVLWRFSAWLKSPRLILRLQFKTFLHSATRYKLPSLHAMLSTAHMQHYYGRHLHLFRKLMEEKYYAVIMPEDTVGAVWPLAIKAANEASTPSLIFPFTIANQNEAVQSLKDNPAFQTEHNKVGAILSPRWRWRRDGSDLVRLPAGHIATHEYYKISPPDPWMMNSGYSTMICVDSQASKDYFTRAGLPGGKILITGSSSHDNMYRGLKAKKVRLVALRAKLRLSSKKPILLMSGCPNQLAGKVPYCEFSSMREIANHVGRICRKLSKHYEVIVRPHPNFLEFGEFLKPWGVIVSMRPTSSLIPLSDVFVAFASATIRWSIACSIPTINYDIFNYRYDDFIKAKGVSHVYSAREFERVCNLTKAHGKAYLRHKRLIKKDAKYWGAVDGLSLPRIENAIEIAREKLLLAKV